MLAFDAATPFFIHTKTLHNARASKEKLGRQINHRGIFINVKTFNEIKKERNYFYNYQYIIYLAAGRLGS